MTKRHRQTLVSLLVITVLTVFAMVYIFGSRNPAEHYTPGTAVDGITNRLQRALPADYPKVKFTDVTREAGIDFHHFPGKRSTQLPEDMGSGVAWGDYNQDGWDDLFVVNHRGPIRGGLVQEDSVPGGSKLYRNNRDGTFTDVTQSSGLQHNDYGMGAAWGDYTGDGLPDLIVSDYGGMSVYKNLGEGAFSEATEQVFEVMPAGYWAGVSWGDYNRDGWLDLYVCGYVQYRAPEHSQAALQYQTEVPASLNPSSFAPERNLLYRNNGNGTMTNVAATAGVENKTGRSLSAAWIDVNHDRYPDLYIANDVSDNVLYMNDGHGSFKDYSHAAQVADYRGAMGIAIADWNLDGDPDLFITHWIAQENGLYDNLWMELTSMDITDRDALRFMDIADRVGLGQVALDYIGFGTSFVDYNNDGRPDLYIANGSTFQSRNNPAELIAMNDNLFWNRGKAEGFYDVSAVAGEAFTKANVGRGVATSDYDRDGDRDIFVVNHQGPGQLLRNDGGNRQNWITINLHAKDKNQLGIGSRVTVYSDTLVQMQNIGAQSSYLSQNSMAAHFGLGALTAVDSVLVQWTDGTNQTIINPEVNRTLKIRQSHETE